ncbi:MAG: hypothetical protein JJ863_01315 [Deltaproteobacteria bacterium]|nr:hypothetical protein [Deltaproteobacteria bacterium]
MAEETVNSEDGVWVVVETHKGVGAVFSYRGLTSRDELDAWVQGELAGALTLRSAYWLDEDNGRLMPVVVGRHGEFRNGTGTLHLAADTIVIVMELRAPDAGILEEKPGQVFQLGAVRSTPSQPPSPQTERTPDDDGNE